MSEFKVDQSADWTLRHIPGDLIRSVWGDVRWMLEELLSDCPNADSWIPEDVYHAVKIGTAHLHVVGDWGCLILQVLKNAYTGVPYLHVWIAYSKILGAMDKLMPELERIAKTVGADKITCHSPFEAFASAGFTKKLMIFERQL